MPQVAQTIVRPSRAARWCRRIGALAVPVLALGAIGHRGGAIPSDAILLVLVVGFGLAVTALALAMYAIVDIWSTGAGGLRDAVIGLLYASPALALLAGAIAGVIVYERLTDVSTDTVDVPGYVASDRDQGFEVSDRSLQEQAYPEITARFYPVPIERAYAAVKSVVEMRGWTVTWDSPPVVEAAPPIEEEPVPAVPDEGGAGTASAAGASGEGEDAPLAMPAEAFMSEPEVVDQVATVEAVARTLLFAFPDDVVVRLTRSADGTRVDMRSASRIGTHDLGQNARRIRAFFSDLDAVLQGMEDAGGGDPVAPSAPSASSPSAPGVPPPRPGRE